MTRQRGPKNGTVAALIELRNSTLDDYIVDGRISQETFRADVGAIAVELDRLLSPDGEVPPEERATRVVAEILADSKARRGSVTPAQAARSAYWRDHAVERPRPHDPGGDEVELLVRAVLDAAEPDEVRMARPIFAALDDESIAHDARVRVRAIAARPHAEKEPPRVPASPDVVWTSGDRLSWEEFIGEVPCQGCGRAFLGEDISRRDGEPWPAYRERIGPVEAEFRSRHPEHGQLWRVGGGPFHCRRCCPPHPLSPQQIEHLNRIRNPPEPSPEKIAPVRRCTTCAKVIEGDHVCHLDDLPRALRAVV